MAQSRKPPAYKGARALAYVDTSAFIAFLDRSDSFHPLFRRLFAAPPDLVTSSLVIAELHGWFLRRYDSRRAMEALRFVQALTPLTIEPFDSDAVAEASLVVRRYQDQLLTLADAHGLATMRSRNSTACWSTDRHLELAGITLVIR